METKHKTVWYPRDAWQHGCYEIPFPIDAIADCSHQGACDDDCEYWEKEIDWTGITSDQIRADLAEYGVWDDHELQDDLLNRQRIVWITANDISDEIYSEHGGNLESYLTWYAGEYHE